MNLEDFNYNTFECSMKYRQYKKIVKKFEQYISIKNVGIAPYLIDKYIESLIYINRVDEAYKNLKVITKYFPKYYKERELGELYIKCNALNDLDELCKEIKNKNNYYHFAKTCLYWNQLEYAKKFFYNFILESEDIVKIKFAVEYIDKINKSLESNIFLPKSYIYFKNNGYELKPGHIIYSYKSSRFNDNTENYKLIYKDPSPYLVWKIVDNTIYAFPLTKNIYNNLTYVIKKSNYNNFLYDERIKDELTIIEKKYVEKVTEIISDEDLNKSLKSVHQLISITQEEDNIFFINERVKKFDISCGDIIQLYDKKLKMFKLFFVIDSSNKNFYKCINICISNDNYIIENSDIVNINTKDFIMECYKISEDEINYIEELINEKIKMIK